MSAKGQGVETDYHEARKWWTLAAQPGHADVQFHLGNMYYKGDGVEKDYREARKWWAEAARIGDANAQFRLGEMYQNGLGVEKDYITAHLWFNIAAAQGHEEARKARDALAQQMSSDQMTEAQRLASVWQARHSQP